MFRRRSAFLGEGEEAFCDPFARGVGATDDEDRVFAGDGAEDVRIPFVVDCFGDWLCAGDDRADDDEFAGDVQSGCGGIGARVARPSSDEEAASGTV